MSNMKIRCARCKVEEELIPDEIKEISNFIMANNLEAVDYLNYLSIKRGRKCTDEKRHTYLFDTDWQEKIIESVRQVKSISDKDIENMKIIEELKGRIKELEFRLENKITENTNLELQKSELITKITESTGNNKWEIWK